MGADNEDRLILAGKAHGEQGYTPAAYLEGAGTGRVQSVAPELVDIKLRIRTEDQNVGGMVIFKNEFERSCL